MKGLTTGVGLWLAGAIGVAAGTGLYAVAVFIAALSFVILYGLRNSPQQPPSAHRPRVDARGELPKESES